MKAKRLRALLVAGLLSLAPAVTLTSCSGGGGGGGGGSDNSNFDDNGDNNSRVELNEAGMPLSLAGIVVKAASSNQTSMQFTFESSTMVRGTGTINGTDFNNLSGKYTWGPDPYDEEEYAQFTLYNNVNQSAVDYRVFFSVKSGNLAVSVIMAKLNGSWKTLFMPGQCTILNY